MTTNHSQILFLCTGNYYRSRFAEHLFNHHAPAYQVPWRAFSRGLAIEMLEEVRSPIALAEQDLIAARHVIALKHAEHHPLMTRKFPDWTDRIEYWHVHDIDFAAPEDALPQIEDAVRALLERLAI